jgi:hypothetical protein
MIPPAWWARLTPWVAGWAGFSTVGLAYGVFLISAARGPEAIAHHPQRPLAPVLARRTGLRGPGAWDW